MKWQKSLRKIALPFGSTGKKKNIFQYMVHDFCLLPQAQIASRERQQIFNYNRFKELQWNQLKTTGIRTER